MKVRLLTPYGRYRKGEELEVSDSEAAALAREGRAVVLRSYARREKAMRKPPENRGTRGDTDGG